MPTISLVDFANEKQDVWFDEIITRRVFPDFRDGLKDSTRSILTAVARLAEFQRVTVDPNKVVPFVQSNYKEGTSRVVTKNLYRMSNINYPLISIVSKNKAHIGGYNRITGKTSRLDYVEVILTELGMYALKYRKYFEKVQSGVSNEEKYAHIKTPLPLSLLIPQVNVADGVSNKAPNLRLTEVVDAMVEHIIKDKNTTTEDLAGHIRGFEVDKEVLVLSTNQALYDLIERGLSKSVALQPVQVYEEEILIRQLPYRMSGITLSAQFEQLSKKPPVEGGFESFELTRVRPVVSEDAVIVFDIRLKPGFGTEDVRREIFTKTYLRENLVYENIVIDESNSKPLTIKSIRQVFDYHYDIGMRLKQLEIEDRIAALIARRKQAETFEKITRPLTAELIAFTTTKRDKEQLVAKLVNAGRAMLKTRVMALLKRLDDTDYDYMKTDYIVNEKAQEVLAKYSRYVEDSIHRSQEPDFSLTTETRISDDAYLEQLLDEYSAESFTKEEIAVIYDTNQGILYRLDKRNTAIATLRRFEGDLAALEALLDPDKIKKELVNELLAVAKPFRNVTTSKTLYASKYQQRQERKDLRKRVQNHLYKMHRELPVNIIVDENKIAYKVIDPIGTPHVKKPKYMFQCTTMDFLVVLNKNTNSYKIPVDEIPFDGKRLADPKDNICLVMDHYDSLLHLFVTNQGRALVTNSNLFAFRKKKLDVSIDDNEQIIYHQSFPAVLYDSRVSVLIKTETNEFKKREITEFKIKDSLKGFFTLFNGASRTDKVTSACICKTADSRADIWEHNLMRNIGYENIRVFKRNVSYGYIVSGLKFGSMFVYDKIPHQNGQFITNLDFVLGRDIGLNKVMDIFYQINHPQEIARLGQLSNVDWCDLETSHRRKQIVMPFEPDIHQINYFINSNTGGRRIFDEEENV